MLRLLLPAALCVATGTVQAQLLISGVVDGPLPGGLPKAIELYATEDIPDLGVFGVGSANNGGGSDGEEFTLSGSAVAGEFLYVASESMSFEDFFGFVPDFVSGNAAAINGDDAIELFRSGAVVDTFGEIDVDGSGQLWEYTDGWAYRMMDSNGPGDGAFLPGDWLFSGPDALDGFDSNAVAGAPFPACSYAAGVFEVTGCESISGPPEDPGEVALLITGVIDGPLSGGTPKAVELLALADITDLGAYGIGSANNGGGSDGEEFSLSGSAVAGQFLYVASEAVNFEVFFGFAADFVASNAVAINGDDAVELFKAGTLVDVFGESAVDGTGEPWEYRDGWAYRSAGDPDSVFALARWAFSGPDALDGETSNADAAAPFPACGFELPGVEASGCEAVIEPPAGDLLCEAPDSDFTPIFELQGARHVSPLLANNLTDAEFYEQLPATATSDEYLAAGVVTAVDSNGFYLQDPAGDGDIATSDGVFVFTGSPPPVLVADGIAVTGPVGEFIPGGPGTRNLSITQIRSVELEVCSSGNPLPAPVVLGSSGRALPVTDIDPDALTLFDPVDDGLDYFESVEGMRVTVEDSVAVAPTSRFGEIFVLANQGAASTGSGFSARGTVNIAPGDFNPERVQIDEDTGIANIFLPEVDTGAYLGDVTGVVGFGFGNYEIYPTVDFTAAVLPSIIQPQRSGLNGGATELSVASYNVLNLDPEAGDGDDDAGSGRFRAIAAQIVDNLDAPDVIGLQEVQDNSGSLDDGVVSAAVTLQTLVDEIAAAGGPAYSYIDNTFIGDGQSGGQPGANIRTAFLYNPARVVRAGAAQPVGSQDTGSAFDGGRLPLAADFFFNGARVTVVNNHFSSKGGSAPIFGFAQDFTARQEDPAVNGSLDERRAQSAEVQAFVEAILDRDEDAAVIVLGDLNEFEFVSPVTALEAAGLSNLTNTLPDDERYSFIFDGNSQSLDHILVSDSLATGARFEVVHVNVEFAETPGRASDHDPLLAAVTVDVTGVDVAALLDLVDAAIVTGGLEGVANNPLTRQQKAGDFRRRLEKAQFWHERGRTDNACRWIELSINAVDEAKPPADLVAGPAAALVADALRAYLERNCGP